MIAAPSMRWRAVLVLAPGAVLTLSDPVWSQTAPITPQAASTSVEEWRATDLSILDFVSDGYDVVSVISSSSHARLYFLTKPGKIVKCREEAIPNSPPPIPPPPLTAGEALVPGRAGTFIPPPESVVTSVRTEFECAELSRRTSRK